MDSDTKLIETLTSFTENIVEKIVEELQDNLRNEFKDSCWDLETNIDDVKADLEAEDDNLMTNIHELQDRCEDIESRCADLLEQLEEVLTNES